ncbi:low affinity immunoglobulin gamma Fc region receptor II-b-like isoform X2 [Oryzias melastigma]|uniref:low affinity immunoglobulin gamma Fc region receptor II-b-like isoform X2 n=1 Tax=Oryzias melastigma TaxID=30732 RepID=UPI00168D537D|nr:low affinity immunoglobulin gamma Fc region receptor II-b-like isoform X2 [Oryzias melastigma]
MTIITFSCCFFLKNIYIFCFYYFFLSTLFLNFPPKESPQTVQIFLNPFPLNPVRFVVFLLFLLVYPFFSPVFFSPFPPTVCLRISPDRSQFFQYQSFTLRCEDPLNSTDWTVKRRTLDGGVRPCSSSGSPCVIRNAFPTDSGVYWCESDDGERSNQINVTVTDLSVILESPALPVREGSAVVLHCKAENHPSHYTYDFFKGDHFIRTNTNGELIIDAASKYDEASYTCGISGGVKSKSSWLSVSATVSPSSSAPPADSESISVFRLVVHLVVGMPYLLSTVLLGLICRDRKKEAEMVADQDQRNHVVMEIDV